MIDSEILYLIAGVVCLLTIASSVGTVLSYRVRSEAGQVTVKNLTARINSWWAMVAIFFIAVASGGIGSILLFSLTSFLALREFITMTPTHRGDHRTLFWAFFLILPINYALIALDSYGIYSIFIPVYAFLFVAIRNALTGETSDFLARTAKIQWALMITVYCVSHAPALINLDIPEYEGENVKLLFFLVFVVQMSDVLQYIWGKTCGRTPVAPQLSPNKIVEGLIGGTLSASLLGTALWWMTPFTPLVAVGMSLVICLMGFLGGLVMSAIKRDHGIKDYGSILPGHGGIMDRIDSLCFAAPVFFHITRFFYSLT